MIFWSKVHLTLAEVTNYCITKMSAHIFCIERGLIEPEHVERERRKREKPGDGTEDEDLGNEGDETVSVDLPSDMVARLRVDLSVCQPTPNASTQESDSLIIQPLGRPR